MLEIDARPYLGENLRLSRDLQTHVFISDISSKDSKIFNRLFSLLATFIILMSSNYLRAFPFPIANSHWVSQNINFQFLNWLITNKRNNYQADAKKKLIFRDPRQKWG